MTAVINPLNWANLSDFKDHLNLDPTDTSRDNFLIRQLNIAYTMAVRYLGQDLNAQEFVEDYDGDGSRYILLNQYPVIQINAIYDDFYRTWQTAPFAPNPATLVDPGNYYFEVTPANVGRIVAYQGIAQWYVGYGNLHVDYNAGYTAIPDDATNAIYIIAAWNGNRAGSEGYTAQSMGGLSQHYDPFNIPLNAREMLLPYRKIPV